MSSVELGYAERCFQGLQPCGDGFIAAHDQGITRVMLVDGIGHGEHANEVLTQLRKQFLWICERSNPWTGISECLMELHERLREARSGYQAAVAIVDVNRDTWQVNALSIGNVKTYKVSANKTVSIPCVNGMVGGNLPRRLSEFELSWDSDSILTMHSDGIHSGGLLRYLQAQLWSDSGRRLESQLIANRIISRFGKENDDASCLVLMRQHHTVK